MEMGRKASQHPQIKCHRPPPPMQTQLAIGGNQPFGSSHREVEEATFPLGISRREVEQGLDMCGVCCILNVLPKTESMHQVTRLPKNLKDAQRWGGVSSFQSSLFPAQHGKNHREAKYQPTSSVGMFRDSKFGTVALSHSILGRSSHQEYSDILHPKSKNCREVSTS